MVKGSFLSVLLESNGGQQTLSLPVEAPGRVLFPFTSYAGIDLTSVDTVIVTLEGVTPAADFSIREIVLGIPEPSASTLTAIAIVLLSLRRRNVRRRLHF